MPAPAGTSLVVIPFYPIPGPDLGAGTDLDGPKPPGASFLRPSNITGSRSRRGGVAFSAFSNATAGADGATGGVGGVGDAAKTDDVAVSAASRNRALIGHLLLAAA